MAKAMAMVEQHEKEKPKLPPKRGQVKVRIFRKFVKLVVSKAERGLLGRKKRTIADGSESDQPPLPR